MVIVAGMLPVGTRGPMIVTGHKYLVAILALALAMRIVYQIGFSHAYERLVERQRVSAIA
jgi:hypothetical protein